MISLSDSENGFISGGSLDWRKLLYSKDKEEKLSKNEQYAILFGACFNNEIVTFSDLCRFAIDNDLISLLLSRSYAFIRVLDEQKSKKLKPVFVHNFRPNPRLRNYQQTVQFVLKCLGLSTFSGPVLEWFVNSNFDSLCKYDLPEINCRRLFSACIDPYTLEPRRQFTDDYNEWLSENDYGVCF